MMKRQQRSGGLHSTITPQPATQRAELPQGCGLEARVRTKSSLEDSCTEGNKNPAQREGGSGAA